MLNGLITAVRTLSIFPVPGKDAEHFCSAFYWFTCVGALLGSILYLTTWGMRFISGADWAEGMAFLILILGVLLTRGFHLDGLADFADGFWGGHSRDRTLAIMKDSLLGTFGVTALILLLLGKWIALVRLLELNRAYWIIPAFVVSRTLLVELSVCLPYARKSGTAGAFMQNAGQRHRAVAFLVALVILIPLYNIKGLIVLVMGWIFSRIFGLWCLKRVGGITGDLLGACCEISETLVLFLAVSYEMYWTHLI